jgi:hypothetical protein
MYKMNLFDDSWKGPKYDYYMKEKKKTQDAAELLDPKFLNDNDVWLLIAINVANQKKCSIRIGKNKWNRTRFRLILEGYDFGDPGNSTYNGDDYMYKLIKTREFLLKNYNSQISTSNTVRDKNYISHE